MYMTDEDREKMLLNELQRAYDYIDKFHESRDEFGPRQVSAFRDGLILGLAVGFALGVFAYALTTMTLV